MKRAQKDANFQRVHYTTNAKKPNTHMRFGIEFEKFSIEEADINNIHYRYIMFSIFFVF